MSFGPLPQKIVLWLDENRKRHAYTTVYGGHHGDVEVAVANCVKRHRLAPARVTVALSSDMPPEKL